MKIELDLLDVYLLRFAAVLISVAEIKVFPQQFLKALQSFYQGADVVFLDLSLPLGELEKGLDKITFLQEHRQFFVLCNASAMSAAFANRLLKIVEEPPVNTSFIFIADNVEAVLPTVASRCILLTQRQLFSQADLPFKSEINCDRNALCNFFGQEFGAKDLSGLLSIIAGDQSESPGDIFQHISINASINNQCCHNSQGCSFFCRLESSCRRLSAGRQNVASSKLLWQTLFCSTLSPF